MNEQHREEMEFHPSSISEWDSFEARLNGERNPDRAWILSDRDVWYPNPSYVGPKQPHPESQEAEWAARDEEAEHESKLNWIEGGGNIGDGPF